jgi:Ca-activated chloride channel homolog
MNIIKLSTLIAMLVLTVPNSFGQQKQDEKKSPTTPPVEIRANVMVVDSAGQYVDDIKLEDLKVFEDNVEQKVTDLNKRERGANVALVIDNSGSMRTQLDLVTQATTLLVVNLDPKDEVMMVRFVSSDKVQVVEDWTSNQAKLIGAIKNKLYIEGGQTALIDAIHLATEKLKERNKSDPSDRSAIVLISDCEDRESHYTREQLDSALKGSGIQLFTIAMTGDVPNQAYPPRQGNNKILILQGNKKILESNQTKDEVETFAKNLATVTGGNTYILNKVTDDTLTKAIKSVISELRSQYSISFMSTNQKRNTTRKLRIEVADGPKGEKRKAVVRETYYVAKG